MAHIGKSIFSFDERDQSDSNVIREDSKESLSDSLPPSRRKSRSRSPQDLPRSGQLNFQGVQLEQQKQLQNLGLVVTELAQQMQGWIKVSSQGQNQPGRQTTKPLVNNYTRARGGEVVSRNATQAEKARSKSRGRRSDRQSKHSKDVRPITKSLSPESKMRRKGEEFLGEIERLK